MLLEKSRVGTATNPVALLQRSGALLFGKFELASGKTTDYYFDSKRLTLDPEGAEFVAKQLAGKLDELGVDVVGGTAYSAIPIASHICLYSRLRQGREIPAFYIRKEGKGHGTNELAEGVLPGKGKRVAIVEDVVTTGGSLLDSIDKFNTIVQEKSLGCTLKHAITLVDRDEGGREAVEARGYTFWSLFTVVRDDKGQVNFRFNGFDDLI